MRHSQLFSLTAAVWVTALSSPAGAVEPTFELGLGLPELTHARVGAFVAPRVSVQLYVSNIIFNWLTGVSVSGYLLGEARTDGPPRHALLAQGTVAFNPLAQPIRIQGGGETIAADIMAEFGYALTTDGGFMFHATAGGLLYLEDTLAAGPNFAISAGWKF